jgi:hypothetical protein
MVGKWRADSQGDNRAGGLVTLYPDLPESGREQIRGIPTLVDAERILEVIAPQGVPMLAWNGPGFVRDEEAA